MNIWKEGKSHFPFFQFEHNYYILTLTFRFWISVVQHASGWFNYLLLISSQRYRGSLGGKPFVPQYLLLGSWCSWIICSRNYFQAHILFNLNYYSCIRLIWQGCLLMIFWNLDRWAPRQGNFKSPGKWYCSLRGWPEAPWPKFPCRTLH